ncbi:MAG: glycosyltransferase family 2 protein [Chloroflexi bacterium]|nr:glycosyltransferase family 2 protein [Chloroflexota bacterium]
MIDWSNVNNGKSSVEGIQMNQSPRPKIVAGMPAYNEGKYVGSLILQAKQYVDKVIVVDDGSVDHTSEVADLAGATVIRHSENKGYGSAIRSILAEAKTQNADILVIFDADSQHDPDEIPSLVKAISEGFDVVIGSREIRRNKIAPYRRLGQRVLSRLTYIASREKLSDTESGFRAYSRKAIATLDLKEEGMSISSEIVSEASAKGLKVTEVPISVTYTRDSSTLNPIRHGFGVMNRIIVMISERRPLLFFGMLGAVLLVLGIATSAAVIWSYYFGSNVLMIGTTLVSVLFITSGLLTLFTGMILNVLLKRMSDRS